MATQRKRIRIKTSKRKGKSRVWKSRWVTVHSPGKKSTKKDEAAAEKA